MKRNRDVRVGVVSDRMTGRSDLAQQGGLLAREVGMLKNVARTSCLASNSRSAGVQAVFGPSS